MLFILCRLHIYWPNQCCRRLFGKEDFSMPLFIVLHLRVSIIFSAIFISFEGIVSGLALFRVTSYISTFISTLACGNSIVTEMQYQPLTALILRWFPQLSITSLTLSSSSCSSNTFHGVPLSTILTFICLVSF